MCEKLCSKVKLSIFLPDEDDLVLWTEAEVAASATAELLKREDLRVSRPPAAPAAAEAPPLAAEAPPPTRLLGEVPELRLLLLPQVS